LPEIGDRRSPIATSDCIEEENKKRVAVALAVDASSTVVSLAHVLRSGTSLDARVDAAWLAWSGCSAMRQLIAERILASVD
jgi:hypothetical protein